jgi:hypothetical protein
MARRTSTLIQIQAPWWEPGEIVYIRDVVSHGDRKAMIKNMIQARVGQDADGGGGGAGSVDLNFRMEEVQEAMLLTMVSSWTLRDGAGKVLPLTAQSIDELADEDVAFICAEIDKRNPQGLAPEKMKAFLATYATSTSEKMPS